MTLELVDSRLREAGMGGEVVVIVAFLL